MEDSNNDSNQKPGWIRWLLLRFHLKPIGTHIVYHRAERAPWYFADGASLLLLLTVLVITGMFMALTYSPSVLSAYESVQHLTQNTRLGWFVRGLHYWSAGVMVVVMLYHVSRHIVLGGYLPPREGLWLIGIVIFFAVLTTSFIGYTLRWDERAVYGLRVALNIFHKIPWIGNEAVRFVQGGWQIGAQTLPRLYAVHVLIIPVLLALLIVFHLYLVLTFGTTTNLERELAPESAEEQIALRTIEKHSPYHGEDFFPYTMARIGGVILAVFSLVLTLTLTRGPQTLFPEANLTEASRPVEEWWFHWYSALAALMPPWLAHIFYWLFPILLFLALISLPFLDWGGNRGARRRPLAVISVAVIVIALFSLTGLRLKSPWTAWPTTDLAALPDGLTLSEDAKEGRVLFTKFGCYACHSIGERGATFAPNLSSLRKPMSQEELRRFILKPPPHAVMPSYEGRLTEKELNRIIDFVLVAQTLPKKF